MSRREFSRSVKLAIIKRATRDGQQYCEKCGALAKRFDIHHLREDALEVDKSRKLTADDGALWCEPCHDDHTRKHSTPMVALAKRQEAAAMGAEKPGKQPVASRPKPDRVMVKVDRIRELREAQHARRYE